MRLNSVTGNDCRTDKLDYYDSLKEANINKYYIENNIRNIKDYDNRYILVNLLNEYELFILIFIIILKLMSAPGEMNTHTLLYVLTGLANTSLFLHKHPLINKLYHVYIKCNKII